MHFLATLIPVPKCLNNVLVFAICIVNFSERLQNIFQIGLHKNIWSDSTEINFREKILQNKILLFTCQIGYIAWAEKTHQEAYNAKDTIFNNKVNLVELSW